MYLHKICSGVLSCVVQIFLLNTHFLLVVNRAVKSSVHHLILSLLMELNKALIVEKKTSDVLRKTTLPFVLKEEATNFVPIEIEQKL